MTSTEQAVSRYRWGAFCAELLVRDGSTPEAIPRTFTIGAAASHSAQALAIAEAHNEALRRLAADLTVRSSDVAQSPDVTVVRSVEDLRDGDELPLVTTYFEEFRAFRRAGSIVVTADSMTVREALAAGRVTRPAPSTEAVAAFAAAWQERTGTDLTYAQAEAAVRAGVRRP